MGKKEAERARALVRERIAVTLESIEYCNELIASEMSLLSARGVAPSCGKGCSHCCRQEIRVPRAEAEAIVDWIETSWQLPAIEALKQKLRAWLAWYRTEYVRLVAEGETRQAAFYEFGPQCPALQDDACSIYPMRPMTCRTHYVTSPPDACRQEGDPLFLGEGLVNAIPSIVRVTEPSALRIRAVVEKQGADFFATVHLLPEWLAHLLRIEEQPWRSTPTLVW